MNQPIPRAGRPWITGFLIVVGAAVIFYAGIFLGRQQTVSEQPKTRALGIARASPKPRVRNVFSPSIMSDPYFLDEQRKLVEALERSCEFQRQNCETARKARAALNALK